MVIVELFNINFRDLFDKKKNEAENNFYLFQQKYKDTEFGIKIVDVLDIFRFGRSDVEDLLNKMIIQRETNQDHLENTWYLKIFSVLLLYLVFFVLKN